MRRSEPLAAVDRRGHLATLRPVAGAFSASASKFAWVVVLAAASVDALAQRWIIEPAVSSQLTWTSNSSFGESGPGESDAIVALSPRVRVNGSGARLRLIGTASVSGIAYADRTQPTAVEPTADLSARLEAIERLFFVEAGYRATRTSENPFGARADGVASSNRLTTSQWSLSPVVESDSAVDLHYRLRSDNTWTRAIGGEGVTTTAGAGGYFGRHSASIERDPRPFGWRLEAERSLTRYDDPAEPSVSIAAARVILNYAIADEWSVGLRGGHERNNAETGEDRSRSIYGMQTRWQPSPRTTLSALREERFFGSAWSLAFDHRQPRLAWSLGLTRGVDTTPQALFDLPPTDNVTGLLDAMFTTRFPDPVERARVVQEFISQQGLPSATQGPVSLFSQRLSLVTSRRASMSVIGSRASLTLSGYAARTEDALDAGPLATGGAASNNTQHGVSLVLSHRLSPLMGLSVSLDWSRIRGLDSAVPDETSQRGLQVHFNVQASPMTNAFLGGRYRKIESNVVTEGREGVVYVGLDHRF